LQLFVSKQNINNIRSDDGDVKFDVYRSDLDTEMAKMTHRYSIKESVFDEIKGICTCLRWSPPHAKHLLLILWIRESKLAMGPLRDDDVYDFT